MVAPQSEVRPAEGKSEDGSWIPGCVAPLVFIAAVIVVPFFVVPREWRWPALGGIVALAAGLGFVAAASRWWGKLLALLLIAAPLTTAVVLLWREEYRAYGVAAAAVPLALVWPVARLVLPGTSSTDAPPRPRPPSTFADVTARFISGIAVAAVAVSVLGFIERGLGSYYVTYGEQVTVTLGGECLITLSSSGNSDTECDDVSWRLDGREYSGTVHADNAEITITSRTVQAYVLPGSDAAYTSGHHTSGPNGMEVFGRLVPWWTPVAPVALALLVGALVYRRPK